MISKFSRFFLCAFALLTSLGASAEVVVRSSLPSSDGHLVTIRGTGILLSRGPGRASRVEDGSRYFVLTVAHVGSGRDATIDINGERARILGALSDSTHDLTLFEIAKPAAAPLAVWNRQLGAFINEFVSTGLEHHDVIHPTKLQSGFSEDLYRPFYLGNGTDGMDSRNQTSLPPFLALPFKYQNRRSKEFNPESESLFGPTAFANVVGEILVKAKIAPGMSGSPAFATEVFGGGGVRLVSYLLGLASQYSLFQTHSFITSPEAMRALFDAYLSSGKRGETVVRFAGRDVLVTWGSDRTGLYRSARDLKYGRVIVSESSEVDGKAGEGSNGNGGVGPKAGGDLKMGLTVEGHTVRVLKITRGRQSFYAQANWTAFNFARQFKSGVRLEIVEKPDWFSLAVQRTRALTNPIVGDITNKTWITSEPEGVAPGLLVGADRLNEAAPESSDEIKVKLGSTDLAVGAKYKIVPSQTSRNQYRLDLDDVSVLNLERAPLQSRRDDRWAKAIEADHSVTLDLDVVDVGSGTVSSSRPTSRRVKPSDQRR